MFVGLPALFALVAHAQTFTVCPASCDFDDATTAIDTVPDGAEILLGDGDHTILASVDSSVTIRAQNPGMARIRAYPYAYAFELVASIDFTLEDVRFENEDGRIVEAFYGGNVTLRGIEASDYNPEGHLIKMATGGTLVIEDSTFTGLMHNGDPGFGGAVVYGDGNADITLRSVVIDGAASVDAGAVYLATGTGLFEDVAISGSSALGHGGAVLVDANASLTVVDSLFEDNDADAAGGHIYAIGELSVTDSQFIDGTAQSLTEGGGAIVAYSGATVFWSSFVGNLADNEGGALYGAGSLIVGSVFDTNTALGSGGAIAGVGGTYTIRGSAFVDNEATNFDGGAIYAPGVRLDMLDTAFIRNDADNGGGAIWRGGGSQGDVIDNCGFFSNRAGDQGGAILYTLDPVETTITSSTFAGNTAATGGAIHLQSLQTTVLNSAFCNNEASDVGGAIAVEGSGSGTGFTIANTVLDGNVSDQGAGAIHVWAGAFWIDSLNNDFLGNATNAAGSASALYSENSGAVDLRNTIFAWNTGGTSAVHSETTSYSATSEFNAFFGQSTDATGEVLLGPETVLADPLLTDYAPGMACQAWDLTPLAGSPVIDAGDPALSDPDGSRSDIGVTGGPDGDADPGWSGPTFGTTTDTDTTTEALDADGDGWSAPEDCDDTDPRVNPDAKEIPNDGKDNDCNGLKATAWLGGRACQCDGTGGAPASLGALLALVAVRRRRSGPRSDP